MAAPRPLWDQVTWLESWLEPVAARNSRALCQVQMYLLPPHPVTSILIPQETAAADLISIDEEHALLPLRLAPTQHPERASLSSSGQSRISAYCFPALHELCRGEVFLPSGALIGPAPTDLQPSQQQLCRLEAAEAGQVASGSATPAGSTCSSVARLALLVCLLIASWRHLRC